MEKKWICTVCGYVAEGPEAPEDWPRGGGPPRNAPSAAPPNQNSKNSMPKRLSSS